MNDKVIAKDKKEIVFSNGAVAVPTVLEDCYIVNLHPFGDKRGYYVTDFIREDMQKLGFGETYQHSESRSEKNVLRGMHFQLDPKCQTKLVRVVTGEAIDVVVDIRVGSPTYGQAIAVHLTPIDLEDKESGKQLFVPRGFAHGFISLKDDTIFQYFVDNSYAPKLEEGIAWNGEETAALFDDIVKEYNLDDLIISAKDQKRMELKDKPAFFQYKKRVLTASNYTFEDGM